MHMSAKPRIIRPGAGGGPLTAQPTTNAGVRHQSLATTQPLPRMQFPGVASQKSMRPSGFLDPIISRWTNHHGKVAQAARLLASDPTTALTTLFTLAHTSATGRVDQVLARESKRLLTDTFASTPDNAPGVWQALWALTHTAGAVGEQAQQFLIDLIAREHVASKSLLDGLCKACSATADAPGMVGDAVAFRMLSQIATAENDIGNIALDFVNALADRYQFNAPAHLAERIRTFASADRVNVRQLDQLLTEYVTHAIAADEKCPEAMHQLFDWMTNAPQVLQQRARRELVGLTTRRDRTSAMVLKYAIVAVERAATTPALIVPARSSLALLGALAHTQPTRVAQAALRALVTFAQQESLVGDFAREQLLSDFHHDTAATPATAPHFTELAFTSVFAGDVDGTVMRAPGLATAEEALPQIAALQAKRREGIGMIEERRIEKIRALDEEIAPEFKEFQEMTEHVRAIFAEHKDADGKVVLEAEQAANVAEYQAAYAQFLRTRNERLQEIAAWSLAQIVTLDRQIAQRMEPLVAVVGEQHAVVRAAQEAMAADVESARQIAQQQLDAASAQYAELQQQIADLQREHAAHIAASHAHALQTRQEERNSAHRDAMAAWQQIESAAAHEIIALRDVQIEHDPVSVAVKNFLAVRTAAATRTTTARAAFAQKLQRTQHALDAAWQTLQRQRTEQLESLQGIAEKIAQQQAALAQNNREQGGAVRTAFAAQSTEASARIGEQAAGAFAKLDRQLREKTTAIEQTRTEQLATAQLALDEALEIITPKKLDTPPAATKNTAPPAAPVAKPVTTPDAKATRTTALAELHTAHAAAQAALRVEHKRVIDTLIRTQSDDMRNLHDAQQTAAAAFGATQIETPSAEAGKISRQLAQIAPALEAIEATYRAELERINAEHSEQTAALAQAHQAASTAAQQHLAAQKNALPALKTTHREAQSLDAIELQQFQRAHAEAMQDLLREHRAAQDAFHAATPAAAIVATAQHKINLAEMGRQHTAAIQELAAVQAEEMREITSRHAQNERTRQDEIAAANNNIRDAEAAVLALKVPQQQARRTLEVKQARELSVLRQERDQSVTTQRGLQQQFTARLQTAHLAAAHTHRAARDILHRTQYRAVSERKAAHTAALVALRRTQQAEMLQLLHTQYAELSRVTTATPYPPQTMVAPPKKAAPATDTGRAPVDIVAEKTRIEATTRLMGELRSTFADAVRGIEQKYAADLRTLRKNYDARKRQIEKRWGATITTNAAQRQAAANQSFAAITVDTSTLTALNADADLARAALAVVEAKIHGFGDERTRRLHALHGAFWRGLAQLQQPVVQALQTIATAQAGAGEHQAAEDAALQRQFESMRPRLQPYADVAQRQLRVKNATVAALKHLHEEERAALLARHTDEKNKWRDMVDAEETNHRRTLQLLGEMRDALTMAEKISEPTRPPELDQLTDTAITTAEFDELENAFAEETALWHAAQEAIPELQTTVQTLEAQRDRRAARVAAALEQRAEAHERHSREQQALATVQASEQFPTVPFTHAEIPARWTTLAEEFDAQITTKTSQLAATQRPTELMLQQMETMWQRGGNQQAILQTAWNLAHRSDTLGRLARTTLQRLLSQLSAGAVSDVPTNILGVSNAEARTARQTLIAIAQKTTTPEMKIVLRDAVRNTTKNRGLLAGLQQAILREFGIDAWRTLSAIARPESASAATFRPGQRTPMFVAKPPATVEIAAVVVPDNGDAAIEIHVDTNGDTHFTAPDEEAVAVAFEVEAEVAAEVEVAVEVAVDEPVATVEVVAAAVEAIVTEPEPIATAATAVAQSTATFFGRTPPAWDDDDEADEAIAEVAPTTTTRAAAPVIETPPSAPITAATTDDDTRTFIATALRDFYHAAGSSAGEDTAEAAVDFALRKTLALLDSPAEAHLLIEGLLKLAMRCSTSDSPRTQQAGRITIVAVEEFLLANNVVGEAARKYLAAFVRTHESLDHPLFDAIERLQGDEYLSKFVTRIEQLGE